MAKKSLLFILIMMISVVTACGGGTSNNTTSSEGSSNTTVTPVEPKKEEPKKVEPVKITYWHIWGADREPILKGIIDTFMKENPDIIVEAILQPNVEYGTKALTALISSPPDVMMLYTDVFTKAARGKSIENIDELMKRDQISPDEYQTAALEVAKVDGKQFGLPYVLNGGENFLGINNKLFKENGLDPTQPPKTFDEYLQVTRKITKLKGKTVEIAGQQNFTFLDALYSNGGKLISDDGQKAVFNSPQGVEALKFVIDLLQATGGNEEFNKFLESGKNAPGGYPFYAGNVGMFASRPFIISQLKNLNPDLDYSIAPLPVGPSGTIGTALVVGGWMNVIPTRSKNKEAAWKLMKYLTYDEGFKDFMGAQVRLSTVNKYNTGDALAAIRANNPFIDQVVAIMATAQAIPGVGQTSEFNAIIKGMVENVSFGKLSVEDALKEAEAKANDYIKKFNDENK